MRACYRLPFPLLLSFTLSVYHSVWGNCKVVFLAIVTWVNTRYRRKYSRIYVCRNTSISSSDLADAQLDNQLRWFKLQGEWRGGRQQHCMQRESLLLACCCLKLFTVNAWKAAEKTHTVDEINMKPAGRQKAF